MSVDVDPAISNSELTALYESTTARVTAAGWSDSRISFQVGKARSVANAGPITLALFEQMRGNDRFLTVSAGRATGCEGDFCVTIATDDPAALLAAVDEMIASAAALGGVQPATEFRATSVDDTATVRAEPSADVDGAVSLWQQIAERGPLDKAAAISIPGRAGHPDAQFLLVQVRSATQQRDIEQFVGTQDVVDVKVLITEEGG
ncbi:hypothetical protein [Subtercola sp. Z020]|uniref:hypothetical protein n=1 Tax=Subtercola sp. Z020 TaxID=2080582 RepID=UPI0011B00380|nr:hypothetical protein [Subtercola sp. Z020]